MSLVNDTEHPGKERLLEMFGRMLLIRETEEKLGALYRSGAFPGSVHLYIGQEATGVGVCAHLNDSDAITSTHRGHGHYLAKGGDPKAMIAEIYGWGDGICKGMGGSMHVADVSKGILGANGIVGGGIGIAAGAAWAARLDRKGAVAVCFIGDGAANQGTLMEALNIASLWTLPLIIVCENNGWSEFSSTASVTAGEISNRARAFDIPTDVVDGNDVVAVWRAAGAAVARARAGLGPSFIETKTYRLRGHTEAEVNFLSETYRTEDEVEAWRSRDPLARAEELLVEAGCDTSELSSVRERIVAAVEAAASAAETGPEPRVEHVFEHMFANQNP